MKKSVFSVFLAAPLLLAASASAQEAAPAAAGAAPATAPAPTPESKEPEFKPVAITANPLSLALLRFGLNIEYLPAVHHGIMLNPFGSFASVDSGASKTSYTNFGAELGYHYYTGSKGANGFFVGPSFIFMSSSSSVSVNGVGGVSSSMTVLGGALDLGGQHVFDNGFTIGGGVGVMYLKAGSTVSTTSSTLTLDGVFPRFLFTVGYSF